MEGLFRRYLNSANLRLLLIASCFLLWGAPLLADKSIKNIPAPDSAEKLPHSFDGHFDREIPNETDLGKFIESSTVTLHTRNYFLNREKLEADNPRAWAQGGSIEYNSGRIEGVFDFSTEYFSSFKLDGSANHGGTLLIGDDEGDINVLGVANPRLHVLEQVISAYRQKFDIPFLNQQDNRMIPNTFEAYVIDMPAENNENFQYITGYLTRMKGRNSEHFETMSSASGVSGTSKGTILGGARYFIVPENLSVSAINLYTKDVANIAYTELVYKHKFDDDMANVVSFQYGDQRSTGEDLLLDKSFSTSFWGIKEAFSYKSFIAYSAFTMTDTGALFRSPYGSYAGYNSVIVEDFNRAGEKSWKIGASYDFAKVGVDGLSLEAAYIGGFDAIDEITKESLNDKDETDITIDYNVNEGILSGFWLRLRGAFVHEEHVGTTRDYRVIVNYDIPLFKPAGLSS